MADRDIQIGLRDRAFRLHDISVTVIGFGNDRLGFGVGAGAYFVHLPKDVREKLLFRFVHRCDLLGIVRIGVDLDRVYRKHLFPNGTAAAHFKDIIGYRVFFVLQLRIVFGIDFLHNGLHTHTRAGILA